MSAIAAIWRMDGRPVAEDIDRMTASLRMYGPDGNGAWHEGGVGLGHCRMIFTPEDRSDRQPIIGGDGTLVLVAAARLDNRSELARDLGLKASDIVGMPDSRLLLRVLETWGEDGVPRLIGAFAFVCWVTRRHRMLAARDALGEYGLFLHRGDGVLAIASMVKGLHAVPDLPREIDERRVAAGLLLLPTGVNTLFQGIESLPPAHLMVADGRTVTIRPYWTPPAANSLKPRDETEAVETFKALLDESVRCRLRSVGGIGSHLSAGLDSGTVTAVAARLLAGEGKRLQAYTSVPREGYDQPGINGRPGDEGPGARALAQMYPNIDHHLIRPGDITQVDALDIAYQTMDQPATNPCNALWYNEIARQARRKGVTVMLTGQMGNMTISYNGRQYLPELLRTGRIFTWIREYLPFLRHPDGWRRVSASIAPLLPASIWRLMGKKYIRQDPFSYSAISPDFAREIDMESLARDAEWNLDYQPWSDGHAMRLAVLGRINVAPMDAGMRAGFGVDHRDPTMDRRLVEFCLALPGKYFLHNGVEGRLLKLAMQDKLPPTLLGFRRKKGYQAVDWHESLTRARESLAEEIERLEASPLASRCLDLPRLRRLVDDWPTGD